MTRESGNAKLFLFAFPLAALFLGIVAGGAAPGPAEAATGVAALQAQEDGAAVYNQFCSACHQPGGVGIEGSFPPLAGNPNATDPDYVAEIIANGLSGAIEVDGVTYDAVMTPINLSDGERAAVIEYVVGLASTTPAVEEASPTPDPEPVVGDASRGRSLFIGATRFENDGGACASCHQAGDVGHLGGASLGPDLDNSFTNFGGEAGLGAWLSAPVSPTMQPIFNDKPLSGPEIADLVAFLETAPNRERPNAYGDALLLGGLAGLAVLLGGMALARRTMNPSYNQRLRSKR